MALLDVLLQATIEGNPLSNEDIREEVATFMFEGHDTVTSGISFALYLISRHPEVEEKIFQECKEVFGDKSTVCTIRHIQELKYTEHVIKEVLRIYPPVPLIGREAKEDIDMNGKIIKAGSFVIIGIYAMQNDSR